MEKIQSQIEESITDQNLVSEALHAMREYRSWAPSTFNSYRTDCEMYENFMYDNSLIPNLENAKLHLVNKWIKTMQAQQVTPATIQRRLAGLSSIYSFYLDLGIVRSNPFKAIDKPVGESHYHSALLEWDEVKEVFHACRILKSKKMDVELTVKMLFYTGLRNQALTNVQVKHVLIEHGLLQVTPKIVNSKNKPQFIPLPPGLLEQIKIHIEEHKLQPEDILLYGLEGLPLKEKQLNRITDRINKVLCWEGEKRVTPHGFRSSLSTLLSERGVDKVAIKIMIGHDDEALAFQENVWIYIRKYKRFINMIRKELTAMEQQLAGQRGPAFASLSATEEGADLSDAPEFYDETTLIELLKTHPKLAKEIITQGLQKKESPVE